MSMMSISCLISVYSLFNQQRTTVQLKLDSKTFRRKDKKLSFNLLKETFLQKNTHKEINSL